MQIKVFKSKIHRAQITQSELHYEGSCTIDKTLMDAARIHQYEAVYIWSNDVGQHIRSC